FSATQGTSFTGPVATFTDTAYPTNLASDFTATIAWGDGTTTPGTIAGGSGTFTVSGTHAYAVPGTFNLSVTIQDDAPGISAATVAAVANVVPILVVTGVPVSIPESSAFSGPVATFTAADPTKPASDFTATIAWGDGTTTPGTIAGSSGSFTVTGTHAYADEGSFPLGVTVTDTVSSVTGSASPTATVSELDNLAAGSPITFSATQGTSFSGPVATFTDSANPTNVASDFTATIAWGDGTTSVGTISGAGGTFTVSGTHTYTGSGTSGVTVTLADGPPGTDSAVAHATATVTATTPTTTPPTSPASPPQSGAGVATTRPSTTNGGALASTGASVLGSSLLGALLVLLGASLVVITRRRSRPS
ncbi:MAG TPA: hypothetical protein VNV87_13030, partial [Acidimicrobiales bacterium]|nr:hypothetical protein [Acidimicrobiales bacterium]